jgi:hypothetical protein
MYSKIFARNMLIITQIYIEVIKFLQPLVEASVIIYLDMSAISDNI